MLRIQDIKKDLIIKSGSGGDGIVSFSNDRKHISFGGKGGEGGSILLKCSSNTTDLGHLKSRKIIATNGSTGENNSKTGKRGKAITIEVPCGTTVVFNEKERRSKTIFSCFPSHEPKILLTGGAGGNGNESYFRKLKERSFLANRGLRGTERKITLSFRLQLDAIVLGVENSGKSTFLRAITSSKANVQPFPFTTKSFEIGMFERGWERFLLVEVPNLLLIERQVKGRVDFLSEFLTFSLIVWVVDISTKKREDEGLEFRKGVLGGSFFKRKKEIIILRDSGNWTETEKNSHKARIFFKTGIAPIFLNGENPLNADVIREKIALLSVENKEQIATPLIQPSSHTETEEDAVFIVSGQEIAVKEGHLSRLYVGGGANKDLCENQGKRLILGNKPLYNQMISCGLSQGWEITMGELTILW